MLESIVQELTEELNHAREAKDSGADSSQFVSGDIDGDETTVDDDDVESFDI